MASTSLQQLRVVEDMLKQIRESIHNLELWNAPYSDVNEMLSSPDGVKTLTADCMLIAMLWIIFLSIFTRLSLLKNKCRTLKRDMPMG